MEGVAEVEVLVVKEADVVEEEVTKGMEEEVVEEVVREEGSREGVALEIF